jgi:hypothetical protein
VPEPELHGLPLTAARRYIGSLAQVARVDSFIEAEGPARGARRLRMITGGGLEIDLHPDRALDIGQVSIDGIPVAWIEPQGIVHPSFYDPHGAGWLRTFGGGFLTTCGLDSFGPPSTDDGIAYGQHGRVGAIPATVITAGVIGSTLVVEAEIRQSSLFGENFLLRRRIEAEIGSTTFTLKDRVTNAGGRPAGHMMMYHINLGWPLVEEQSQLSVPSTTVTPRDSIAAAGIDAWSRFESPEAERSDHVFLHSFDETTAGLARLENPRLGLSLAIEWDRETMPWLCEWKMLQDSSYVVGLEPVNSPTMVGRETAHRDGVLPVLEPGESVDYDLRCELGAS